MYKQTLPPIKLFFGGEKTCIFVVCFLQVQEDFSPPQFEIHSLKVAPKKYNPSKLSGIQVVDKNI